MIAGYRLVRMLARGRHSDLWLGVSRPVDAASTAATDAAPDAAATHVAIKLFHPATPLSRIDVEAEALGRASHRHVQRLLDISLDPDGRACLVLERLGQSLARVLATRGGSGAGGLTAGEAVTVLAPACLAVAELHRVGVAHGRIDAGSILFDSSGAPVLTRLGDAHLVGEFAHPPAPSSLTPAQAAADPDLRADRKQLAELALLVLSPVRGAESVTAWVQQQTSTEAEFAVELAERLFSMAPAVPVAIRPETETDRAGTVPFEVRDALKLSPGATALLPPPVDESAEQSEPDERVSLFAGIRRAAHIPEWLDKILDEWLSNPRGLDIVTRVRRALAPVRKPVWVAAAAGVAALLVAVVLLGGSDAQTVPLDASVAEESPGSAHAAGASATAVTTPAGLADPDPVVAARALLELRAACIRDLSVLCLDRVNQQDSAAMDADRHLIRQRQVAPSPPGDRDLSTAELVLIDELGDGALLDLVYAGVPSEGAPPVTASLLLVRTEIGWLIRDLVQ